MTTRNVNKSMRRSERGQSLVELTISILFMLLLLSGAVDLGWAYFTLTSLRDAAQEGASFASICQNEAQIRQRVRTSGSDPIDLADALVSDDQIEIEYYTAGSSTATVAPAMGMEVRVTVRMQHEILMPFLGALINSQTYPLSAQASNTILRTRCP